MSKHTNSYRSIMGRAMLGGLLLVNVRVFFPMVNLILVSLGLIEIHSPPGPPRVNDYQPGRPSLVLGCEDVEHQFPTYPRPYPEYNVVFMDEIYFAREARISKYADYIFPVMSPSVKYSIRESLRLAARRSRQANNDLAADQLEHMLDNTGQTLTDFNVEGLLHDLPVLHELVRQTLQQSVGELVAQEVSLTSTEGCHQVSATSSWIVAGIGGTPSIMPNIHIDTTPFSPTFHLLYEDANYPYRDELDVWMAMDPVWYAIGQSLIVNTVSTQAEVCYQVFIYFPYHWPKAGLVDNIIGLIDGLGISEHYTIEGTSGIRCEGFQQRGLPYEFDGLLANGS